MSPKLRVTFVLPRTGEWPSGGLRIVYEHANYLCRRGHVVSAVHPARLVTDPTWLDHSKNAARYVLRSTDRRYTPVKWLAMHPKVRLLCVPSLSERFLPDGDVVIATGWRTAEYVTRYSKAKGRGFYFIQHLETWDGPEERVYATWKLPLQKIVVSKWLAEVARGFGQSAIYIPNALDVEGFPVITPAEERLPNYLVMLYHAAPWKGVEDGLRAISYVREREPGITVSLFGVAPRPSSLPEWIHYEQSPSPRRLRELYNRAAIFIAPSLTEGWGLPACEAMLSGSALVATDIDGHREFAFNERTALTSHAKAPGALAENILRLIRNPSLRIELAKNGRDFVRQFTWDRATTSLESALIAQAPVFDESSIHIPGLAPQQSPSPFTLTRDLPRTLRP